MRELRICVCFSCQFVVTDDQDYKAHFTDPDTLVNWDCVQQVVSACHPLKENIFPRIKNI